MEVHFTPEQEAFIHQGIVTGRYHNAEEAVREAMAQWEEDERGRMKLLDAFDDAEGTLRQDGIPITPMTPCPNSPKN